MLVQQLNAKGRPRAKYDNWTPEFWDKMVLKWGNKLRWRKVPEPVNVNDEIYISDCADEKISIKSTKRKKK